VRLHTELIIVLFLGNCYYSERILKSFYFFNKFFLIIFLMQNKKKKRTKLRRIFYNKLSSEILVEVKIHQGKIHRKTRSLGEILSDARDLEKNARQKLKVFPT
jgi:hypothetical protein